MKAYAIVSGQIVTYLEETLKYTSSEYDSQFLMVEYESPYGVHCVTPADNFLKGSLEELTNILKNRDHEIESTYLRVKELLPTLSSLEDRVLKFLVQDGYSPEEIDYGFLKETAQGCCAYLECNASLEDAYMDYMH